MRTSCIYILGGHRYTVSEAGTRLGMVNLNFASPARTALDESFLMEGICGLDFQYSFVVPSCARFSRLMILFRVAGDAAAPFEIT